MLNSRKVILIWLLISLCVATTHSTVTTKPPVKPKPAATPKQAVTTTSVPTVEPEPINIQYKAMLYRLDFQTIPTISPAMRAVLLLTTLYYIIVFAKHACVCNIFLCVCTCVFMFYIGARSLMYSGFCDLRICSYVYMC